MTAYYKEYQKWTQLWLWTIIILSTIPAAGLILFGFVKQLIFRIPWGSEPMSDVGLALVALFTWTICGGIIAMIFLSKLELEVRDKAIFYRFPIFIPQQKRIGMEDIVSWDIESFGPLDYGGYGVRKTLRKGTALIIKGRYGLKLKLRNGKMLMLGTQKPEELRRAVQNEWDRFKRDD